MSVGSWLTLDHVDERQGLEVLAMAMERGVNFFDDARYDDRTGKAPIQTGYAEVVFGELFRKGGWRREDVVIGNKVWLEFFPDESVEEELDGSLVLLQMDYMDIVYVVPPPKDLPMAELVEMMSAAVDTGKIRCWGGLNWNAAQILAAQEVAQEGGYAPFSAAQLPYNLLYRAAVEGKEMPKVCRDGQVGIVASYGLGGGLLTNKYASGKGGAGDRLTAPELATHRKRGAIQKVAALAKLADELLMTPAELALAYCLKGPSVASVLFGAKTPAQVEENLGALTVQRRLDDKALARVRSLLRQKTGSSR